jgi:hypothetical protein
MRNLFDQYEQPENRLTHALFSTLSHDRRLIRPFLQWLKIGPHPAVQRLQIAEQQIPGVNISGDVIEAKGLPDACIFDSDEWALLFESKVQASTNRKQLERHLKTAARHGYGNAQVILIAVNQVSGDLPERVKTVEWRQVYLWFRKQAMSSSWARSFVEYMQVFESKMIAREYMTQGTLTMFDGLCFDEDNPYTCREGKRLIRLLRDELRQRKDLQTLGIEPDGEGRSALTGRNFDPVWDYISLKQATNAAQHTAFPHLTLGMNSKTTSASVTIPNGVRGGFRTKIGQMGTEQFRSLVATLECAMRPVISRSEGARPIIYATQRHFPSQRSAGIEDGRIDIDMRTLVGCAEGGIKCQPEWIDAVYKLLTNKHSNIQFGVQVHFKYDCPIVRSRKVLDLFADTWISLKPLLDFVLLDE